MIVKESRHSARKSTHRYPSGHDQDVAQISASLRELAVRAHRLVRTSEDADFAAISDENRAELIDVHTRIVELHRQLGAQRLSQLGSYVSALRERIQERLA
jgi:hypothetical protein